MPDAPTQVDMSGTTISSGRPPSGVAASPARMTLAASTEVLESRREEMPERAQAALDLLVADVARFQGLVEDLLEISRVDGGSAQLNLEDVRVAELVPNAVEAVSADQHIPVAVGPDVTDFRPGDDVMAVGEGTLGNYVITPALLAAKKPERLVLPTPPADVASIRCPTCHEYLELAGVSHVNGDARSVGAEIISMARALAFEEHYTTSPLCEATNKRRSR